MSQEQLTLVLIYYGLTTVFGAMFMSWHFSVRLNRDALGGAFAGFGSAFIGFGLLGLGIVYFLMPPQELGLMDEDKQTERGKGHLLNSLILGEIIAAALVWLLLVILVTNNKIIAFLTIPLNLPEILSDHRGFTRLLLAIIGFVAFESTLFALRGIRTEINRNVLWALRATAYVWLELVFLAVNTEPSRFLVVVAGGMYEGMLIFLVAAGFSIIFGLMDVLNLAQGAFFMIGAYAAWDVYGRLGEAGWRDEHVTLLLAFFIALLVATALGALIGLIVEVTLIRPTYARPIFQLVLTFGLALALREAVISRYGNEGVANTNLRLQNGDNTVLTGLFPDTSVQNYWIFMIVMGILMIFGVQYLLQNTRIGIIIRAGVQDSEMVEALGINVRLIFTLVFMLGAAIAALGGGIASGFLAPNPALGDTFLLQAIAVVIVGGLGSYSGTAIASIILGITGAVASHFAFVGFNSDALGSTAILLILLVVLYIKPTGLFGKAH